MRTCWSSGRTTRLFAASSPSWSSATWDSSRRRSTGSSASPGSKEEDARPFGLAALIGAELERRADKLRARSVVLQRELDFEAPPARADEERIRFAIGMLFDRALRMLPSSGELYVGSLHQAESADRSGHHRVLIRFQSPEEVLIAPEDGPGPSQPLEVVLARALIEGVGGSFAVDVSGVQDNIVLIELPG